MAGPPKPLAPLPEPMFRAMVEQASDGIFVTDATLRIEWVNDAAAAMLGLHSEQMVGKLISELVEPEDLARAPLRSHDLRAGVSTRTIRRFRTPTGELRLLEVSAKAIGDGRMLGLARDVTDRERMQLQLAQAERMASLGTLAAGVGHEINNPLAYVLLNLEGIARIGAKLEPKLAASLNEHVTSAVEGAQRVAKIVRDLRAFSRFDDDARTIVDARRALEVALSTASHELKHRARVVTELDEVVPVLGSEGRLAQIFLNLLINAAHAIPEGHPRDNEIRVSARLMGDEVRVSISDTGVGIADEHKRHLFEPFFTTKEAGEGSGLGLAICHGLVTALGGTIGVESRVGQGSTFSVILPRASVRSPAPPAVELTVADATSRGKILVIDDELSICQSIAEILRPRHDVVFTTSAGEARVILERDPAFDVLVCDVVMPEMTGADLHRYLVEHAPALAARMLFITGGREGEAARSLAGIEPWRWLEKPFGGETLEKAIGVMLASAARRVG